MQSLQLVYLRTGQDHWRSVHPAQAPYPMHTVTVHRLQFSTARMYQYGYVFLQHLTLLPGPQGGGQTFSL